MQTYTQKMLRPLQRHYSLSQQFLHTNVTLSSARNHGSVVPLLATSRWFGSPRMPNHLWFSYQTKVTTSIIGIRQSSSNSSTSAHDPAVLNLSGSAGSQAAQTAIGTMTNEERAAMADAAATDGSQTWGNMGAAENQRIVSAEESHRHASNVSLHSAMQSNVPQPYEHENKSPGHLNMPSGGQLRQVAFDSSKRFNVASSDDVNSETPLRDKSASAAQAEVAQLSQSQRMKKAVAEYGGTVVVFHTCLSLTTLGISYLAVSSGVDVVGLLGKIGLSEAIIDSKLATGASTFVIAYAAHKVFAPARMAITLTSTPFIVRYLRRIGFLKAPPKR